MALRKISNERGCVPETEPILGRNKSPNLSADLSLLRPRNDEEFFDIIVRSRPDWVPAPDLGLRNLQSGFYVGNKVSRLSLDNILNDPHVLRVEKARELFLN